MPRKGLIVIDMQKDFIDGSLGTKEAVAIVPVVKQLIDSMDYNELYFTMDTHGTDYLSTQEGLNLPVKHCIVNTNGWKLHEDMDTGLASKIIRKRSFGYTGWNDLLGNLSEVTLVGLCTDICVISNALIIKAQFPEMRVNIVENATAGVTPERKAAALETARSCQINII